MIISSTTPKLDLHGEIVAMVEVLVNGFINYNYLLNIEHIVIIHGKSTNILTKEVHRVLKNNKFVRKYFLNNWNTGETIAQLNKK